MTTLVQFAGTNGASPLAGLTLGADNLLYGTTRAGGSNNYGTVFKVTASGTLATLAQFDTEDGVYPSAGVTLDAAGNIYGTTTFYSGTVFWIGANGWLTTLHQFDASGYNGFDVTNVDGFMPVARMTFGADGNFYGTASSGGSAGKGTVFKISTNGSCATLHAFAGSDGAGPRGELLSMPDGGFYGTTQSGGTNGQGTVFKMTTSGTLTTLVHFNTTNGANPVAGLILGTDGNLYGTTRAGGSRGNGTVFQITTDGTLRTFYSFTATVTNRIGIYTNADGAVPFAGLVLDGAGFIYGLTTAGGTNGNGTIFRLGTNGTLKTLYSFTRAITNASGILTNADGAFPAAALTAGFDGCFYGTTASGGRSGSGTIFKLSVLPYLDYQMQSGKVILNWTDPAFSLQSASEVGGTYTNIHGAKAPFTYRMVNGRQFFRLISN